MKFSLPSAGVRAAEDYKSIVTQKLAEVKTSARNVTEKERLPNPTKPPPPKLGAIPEFLGHVAVFQASDEALMQRGIGPRRRIDQNVGGSRFFQNLHAGVGGGSRGKQIVNQKHRLSRQIPLGGSLPIGVIRIVPPHCRTRAKRLRSGAVSLEEQFPIKG